MNSNQLREKFLNFFEEKGHKVIPSASLVPKEEDITEADKTLFATAGMQQFKRFYSSPEAADYSRAVSIQKCIRTGDIDEVGDDTHLSFFEMFGNFSFGYPSKEGSYFKKEAICWAWEFLTEGLGFDKSRIHATYFKGEKGISEDRESCKILQSINGLPKIEGQGFDDNFWSLGSENSPGGPTVEFYIDGIEVWNLVFNEYILKNGKYISAKYSGVDTGMGFERLLAVINGWANVYFSELFMPIIEKITEISGRQYENNQINFRIIADHIKAAIFAINDGALPSNKGAGYIVRRLIRRAIAKADQLGVTESFTDDIAEVVFNIYDKSYQFDKEAIIVELQKEEVKFRRTLANGIKKLEEMSQKGLDGAKLFDLYQSFGLPLELSVELAKERQIAVGIEAIDQFHALMRKHQELSRTASAGMFKGGLADSGEETTKLHTAAHLLLAALRKVLGESVFQKGSNITQERLRFDFSYPEKMTPSQIKEVENIVNDQIEKDLPISIEEMTLEEAKKAGAMGVFESKYGEKVKVYTIGGNSSTPDGRSEPPFSREICGGPHVSRTGELGRFKIQKEESSSAGVRRIKAILSNK